MRHKLLFTLTLLLLLAAPLLGQQPITVKLAEYNHDLRYCISSAIANDSHIHYVIDDENDALLLFSADAWDDDQFSSYLQEMKTEILEEYQAYETFNKSQQGDLFSIWKSSLSDELFSFLFKLTLMESPMPRDGNQTCATSEPFCTSEIVTFHVEANPGGSCENGPYYGCLSSFTQRPPFWFHMKIGIAGNFTIRMTNTAHVDIDYCCWGPFNDPVTPCPSQLTQNKYIDCGSSGSDIETCDIPESAQVGQYYILVITKYNLSQATDITFRKVDGSGPGETDCAILPPLVDNDGPFCVGDAIHLTGNAQTGASYHWTGPNGYSSTQQNPVLNNCTLAMAGTYTCTITVGSQSSNASTEVQVFAQPTANFNFTSVCKGNSTQFTSTTTTNPPGQPVNYRWNFGDGQSSSQQNPSHQYATAGNHQVTLTVSSGNGSCTSSKTQTVTVYETPIANAGNDQTIPYGASAQLRGSGGSVGAFSYHWEPADKVVNPDAQNTQTIELTETETFFLTVSNPQGDCTSDDQVNILVQGSAMAASASASPSTLCEGDSTRLQALAIGGTGNYTYSWSPTLNLGDPHSPNPIAFPTETITYTCVISDGQTTQSPSVTVTVNHPAFEEETQYICPDETYNFYGVEYSAEGDYDFNTTTAQGCDKTITLHLHHYSSYQNAHTTIDSICSETSCYFHGHYYNTTGLYPDTLESMYGCDSIVWLNLTVFLPNDTLPIEGGICESQTYPFHGNEYNQPGTYYFDTIDSHGCPRVEKLVLTVGPYQVYTENVFECYAHNETPSYYWDKNQQTYTADTNDEIILDDPDGGCPIKYRLNLKFHQEYYNQQSVTECDSYYWPLTGLHYTSSVHDSVPYLGGGGALFNCDSIYILDLTINHSYEGTKTVNGQCDEYVWDFGWNNESYSYTNDHPDNEWTRTIPTAHGCDSTVTLKLQIDHSPSFAEVKGKGWVIGGSEFQYNIEKYWVETPPESSHLTEWYFNDPAFNRWQLVPFGMNNDSCLLYIFTFEKDSIELCAKTFGPCGEFTQSKWIHCSFQGVSETATDLRAEIFPNPNDGEMTLALENMTGTARVFVFDLTGTLVDQFEVLNLSERQTHRYHASHLPPGAYFFRISSPEGTLTKKVMILK